jgi:hypothetical protein
MAECPIGECSGSTGRGASPSRRRDWLPLLPPRVRCAQLREPYQRFSVAPGESKAKLVALLAKAVARDCRVRSFGSDLRFAARGQSKTPSLHDSWIIDALIVEFWTAVIMKAVHFLM